MIELSKGGAYLLNGTEIIEDGSNAAAELSAKLGNAAPSKEEAAKNTIAYGILNAHNTSGSMDKLKIKFDNICRYYTDSKSIRIGKVPDSLCFNQLS